MTKLEWDAVGSRRFETGCDRGVLFLPDGSAVPWNGLRSVVDTSTGGLDRAYLDGVNYLNRSVPSDYSGVLTAFTWPDEFSRFIGLQEFVNGVVATNQPVTDTFSLSYRTKLGNDVDGTSHGYRVHILYNLSAIADDRTANTLSTPATPEEFKWSLIGKPISIPNMRPTAHIIADSTTMDPGAMDIFEMLVYGTDITPPTLPTVDNLQTFTQDVIFGNIQEPI